MRLVDSPLRVADWDVLAEGASIATSAGQLEVAEDLLETYLERRPYSASHWSMLARLRAELGKADARRRAETNADLAEQNLIREGRRRAYQYANAGEVEDARTLLERMHRRYPDHAGIEEQLHDVEASITDQSAASSG
jgi:predicted Zn-dependent protease